LTPFWKRVRKSRALLVDTHCHLDFSRFDRDRDEVIRRAEEAGVTRLVIPGLDLQTSRKAIALAERHAGLYAAVGVHPNSVKEAYRGAETLAALRELARHPRVVAVGEIGLDYYRDNTPPAEQMVAFWAQLKLAADIGKPVILHNREATTDTIITLARWREEYPDAPTGVLHSFSGTWEDAQRVLGMGFYLGFTGPITYEKADRMREVAGNAPADRMVVETDAPFLTPHPFRGKRNEPAYVHYVAEKLAEVRGERLESVAQQTTNNAVALFRGMVTL
jgi:TatD DNase family protein